MQLLIKNPYSITRNIVIMKCISVFFTPLQTSLALLMVNIRICLQSEFIETFLIDQYYGIKRILMALLD